MCKIGNNSSYALSQIFLLQQVAYTLDYICAKKKRFKLYWLIAGKKNLTSPTKSALKQSFTSQASNIL